ncbi:MAG: RNA polymerase sigma factor [Verrucomicrobiota bacterium]
MMEADSTLDTNGEVDRDEVDQALILRLQQGDDLALNEIMLRYQQALHSYAYRFVNDTDEAADLVQEAFVRVYLKRSKYKPKGKFRTWLYTITGNLCRDWIRSRKRRPLHYVEQIFDSQLSGNVDLDQMRKPSPDPAQLVMAEEKNTRIMRAIDTLPVDLKQALILFSLEGNTQEEVGILLGCSVKAVETRVYRAKKQLKKYLQNLD